jgi:hypothetical protein
VHHVRRLAAPLVGLALVAACHSAAGPGTSRVPARADSLILERTRCFGSCPAYRLTLRADGRVSFVSLVPRDSSLIFLDSIAPAKVAWLVEQADRIGLAKLPPVIAADSTLCTVRATDHPTATVALFRAGSTTRVEDYRGCYAGPTLTVAPSLARLRRYAGQIDSVARTERWTAPMTRR